MIVAEAILAFDVETKRLASEVEAEYADELAGASAWARPDLFGFAVGCAVDLASGVAVLIPPGGKSADFMVRLLECAETVVSYNGEDFDLGVLSAGRSVEGIREGGRHVDLCAEVREALADLPEAQAPGVDHLRSGGLDALARTNGLEGKTGSGEDAVSLYREGRIEELLSYCEQDARLVADLYRLAREQGELRVEAYYRNEHDERRYLPGPVYVPLAL